MSGLVVASVVASEKGGFMRSHDCVKHHDRFRPVLAARPDNRAHIMASWLAAALVIHFAPTIDTSHALVSAMEQTLEHSELCQFVRLIPPSFLRWLIREFGIKGEAHSTPLTCADVPFHDNGIIKEMPTCLKGVSIHPSQQTQHPISFDGQFSDTTSAKSEICGDREIRTEENRRTSRRSACELEIVPASRTYPGRSVGRSGRPTSPVGRCS